MYPAQEVCAAASGLRPGVFSISTGSMPASRVCAARDTGGWVVFGGYHDFATIIEDIRTRLFDRWEEEMRLASGLVDEARYSEHFDRYIGNVNVWVKGETVKNRVTGADERADGSMGLLLREQGAGGGAAGSFEGGHGPVGGDVEE